MADVTKEWRIGVDVGGSFTDLVAFNTRTNDVRVEKVPTVRSDPALGVLTALERLESHNGIRPNEIDAFLHGTTIGTNALLEMKGAKVGLLVTQGFDAVPTVQAGNQPRPFLLFYHRPESLVHPTLVRGIPERIDRQGNVVRAIDLVATRQAVRELRDAGVDSIAVCFMFSFANPEHEQAVKRVIVEEHSASIISLSSEIMPRIREWQRMSTTLVNAYLEPVLTAYVRSLDERLAKRGTALTQRFLMQSNGGVMPFSAVIRGGQTHHTLLSGPAAGAISAAYLCATQGFRNVISLDVGGTSADVAFIEGVIPHEVTQGVIEGRAIYSPMVDVEAVSAGGGTIARVDAGGLLRVGPASAGSDPGPACYGRGGVEATITDADMVLGYLSEDVFLGGSMRLNQELAKKVIQNRLATPLNSASIQEAAWGVIRVLEVKMADRIQSLAAERGISLGDFGIVAGGGAGPLHATGVADELGISKVLVPPRPGAFSALGLLCSDVIHDYVQTAVSNLATTDLGTLNERFNVLEEQAIRDFYEEGLQHRRRRLLREADVRYVGQGFELRISVPGRSLTETGRVALRNRFEHIHKRLYGHSSPSQAVEIVSFRLRAIVPVQKFEPLKPEGGIASSGEVEVEGTKPMWFGGEEIMGSYYLRENLSSGSAMSGPCVIYQDDSTTVVPPNWNIRVDENHNLVLTKR